MKQLSVLIDQNAVQFFEDEKPVLVLGGLSPEALEPFRDGYRQFAGTVSRQAFLQGAMSAFAGVVFEMNKPVAAEKPPEDKPLPPAATSFEQLAATSIPTPEPAEAAPVAEAAPTPVPEPAATAPAAAPEPEPPAPEPIPAPGLQ